LLFKTLTATYFIRMIRAVTISITSPLFRNTFTISTTEFWLGTCCVSYCSRKNKYEWI